MSFNFAYGPDVFQGLDMDAFLKRMQSSPLPEKSEAEMKARQMLAGGGTAAGGGLPAIALPGILEPVNPPTGNELPIGSRPPLPGDPGYDPGIAAGIAGMIPATTVNPPSFTNIDDYLAGIVSLKPGPIGSNLDYDLLLRERQSSPLPEKSEAEMKARQFMAQKAPTSEAVTTTRSSSSGSGSSGSEGIPSLRQMIFERYQPLVSQQRNYQSYIG